MEAEYKHGRTVIKMWPDFSKGEVDKVIGNPRQADVEEFEELGFDWTDAIRRKRDIVGSTPVSYMVYYDDKPVFMFGLTFSLRHTASLWGFGTEDACKAIPVITRFVRRKWLQDVRTGGLTRIEARVPAHSLDSLQWLNSCGMRAECQLPGVSVTGAPVIQLSYTWDAT